MIASIVNHNHSLTAEVALHKTGTESVNSSQQ